MLNAAHSSLSGACICPEIHADGSSPKRISCFLGASPMVCFGISVKVIGYKQDNAPEESGFWSLWGHFSIRPLLVVYSLRSLYALDNVPL